MILRKNIPKSAYTKTSFIILKKTYQRFKAGCDLIGKKNSRQVEELMNEWANKQRIPK